MSDDLFQSLRIAEKALNQSAELRRLHCTSVQLAVRQAEAVRKLGLSNDAMIQNINTAMKSPLIPAWNVIQQQRNPDGMTAAVLGLSVAMQTRNAQLPKNMAPLMDALRIQSIIIENAATAVQTPAITALMEDCQNQRLTYGMGNFLRTLESVKVTEASNIAFLKNISAVVSLEESKLPYGWKSIVNKMHKQTAKKLVQVSDIRADIENKSFIADESSGVGVHVGELNVIFSATDLFSEITAHDLIMLQNTLEKGAAFALEENAGRRIYEIIRDWNGCIDFDRKYYYHCRERKAEEAPYTEEDMKRAPRGCVGPGRYNYSGICHYYFSDTEYGARTEVLKHHKGASVQTARLRPVKQVKLMDLSGENKKKIKFLDYIRFEVKDTAKLPREYLIPQFVASCCERVGIEGIKYYGSREYSNYVTWNDGYFKVEDMWTEEPVYMLQRMKVAES